MNYLNQLIGFVSLHAELAYAAIFLAAFLEAIPILGTLVPGSTVILALSALIPAGSLGLTPVLASAIAGAVIGEALAYSIGYVSQREILTSWPMSKYPAVMAQSEEFFHRYGTFAVFFARFVPPVRALVPVVAGALGMPP
nr:DedA family protein [Afipia sp.]